MSEDVENDWVDGGEEKGEDDDEEEFEEEDDGRGGGKFSTVEMKVLIREVEKRQEALFGEYKEGESPKSRWLIWQEVAEKVNEVSVTHRNLEQVRVKWFDYKNPNNVRRMTRRRYYKRKYEPNTGMFMRLRKGSVPVMPLRLRKAIVSTREGNVQRPRENEASTLKETSVGSVDAVSGRPPERSAVSSPEEKSKENSPPKMLGTTGTAACALQTSKVTPSAKMSSPSLAKTPPSDATKPDLGQPLARVKDMIVEVTPMTDCGPIVLKDGKTVFKIMPLSRKRPLEDVRKDAEEELPVKKTEKKAERWMEEEREAKMDKMRKVWESRRRPFWAKRPGVEGEPSAGERREAVREGREENGNSKTLAGRMLLEGLQSGQWLVEDNTDRGTALTRSKMQEGSNLVGKADSVEVCEEVSTAVLRGLKSDLIPSKTSGEVCNIVIKHPLTGKAVLVKKVFPKTLSNSEETIGGKAVALKDGDASKLSSHVTNGGEERTADHIVITHPVTGKGVVVKKVVAKETAMGRPVLSTGQVLPEDPFGHNPVAGEVEATKTPITKQPVQSDASEGVVIRHPLTGKDVFVKNAGERVGDIAGLPLLLANRVLERKDVAKSGQLVIRHPVTGRDVVVTKVLRCPSRKDVVKATGNLENTSSKDAAVEVSGAYGVTPVGRVSGVEVSVTPVGGVPVRESPVSGKELKVTGRPQVTAKEEEKVETYPPEGGGVPDREPPTPSDQPRYEGDIQAGVENAVRKNMSAIGPTGDDRGEEAVQNGNTSILVEIPSCKPKLEAKPQRDQSGEVLVSKEGKLLLGNSLCNPDKPTEKPLIIRELPKGVDLSKLVASGIRYGADGKFRPSNPGTFHQMVVHHPTKGRQIIISNKPIKMSEEAREISSSTQSAGEGGRNIHWLDRLVADLGDTDDASIGGGGASEVSLAGEKARSGGNGGEGEVSVESTSGRGEAGTNIVAANSGIEISSGKRSESMVCSRIHGGEGGSTPAGDEERRDEGKGRVLLDAMDKGSKQGDVSPRVEAVIERGRGKVVRSVEGMTEAGVIHVAKASNGGDPGRMERKEELRTQLPKTLTVKEEPRKPHTRVERGKEEVGVVSHASVNRGGTTKKSVLPEGISCDEAGGRGMGDEELHPLVRAALVGKPIDFETELRKVDEGEKKLNIGKAARMLVNRVGTRRAIGNHGGNGFSAEKNVKIARELESEVRRVRKLGRETIGSLVYSQGGKGLDMPLEEANPLVPQPEGVVAVKRQEKQVTIYSQRGKELDMPYGEANPSVTTQQECIVAVKRREKQVTVNSNGRQSPPDWDARGNENGDFRIPTEIRNLKQYTKRPSTGMQAHSKKAKFEETVVGEVVRVKDSKGKQEVRGSETECKLEVDGLHKGGEKEGGVSRMLGEGKCIDVGLDKSWVAGEEIRTDKEEESRSAKEMKRLDRPLDGVVNPTEATTKLKDCRECVLEEATRGIEEENFPSRFRISYSRSDRGRRKGETDPTSSNQTLGRESPLVSSGMQSGRSQECDVLGVRDSTPAPHPGDSTEDSNVLKITIGKSGLVLKMCEEISNRKGVSNDSRSIHKGIPPEDVVSEDDVVILDEFSEQEEVICCSGLGSPRMCEEEPPERPESRESDVCFLDSDQPCIVEEIVTEEVVFSRSNHPIDGDGDVLLAQGMREEVICLDGGGEDEFDS